MCTASPWRDTGSELVWIDVGDRGCSGHDYDFCRVLPSELCLWRERGWKDHYNFHSGVLSAGMRKGICFMWQACRNLFGPSCDRDIFVSGIQYDCLYGVVCDF